MIPNGLMSLPSWQDPNQPQVTPVSATAPAAPAAAPRSLLDPLSYIEKYESAGRNVPNYINDKTHTANGYYQITNTNWRNIAPKLGIDTKQYPTAMSAPKEVQGQVASHMYNNRGFADWAPYNPDLRKAIAGAGGESAFVAPGDHSLSPSTATADNNGLGEPKYVPSLKVASVDDTDPNATTPTGPLASAAAPGKDDEASDQTDDRKSALDGMMKGLSGGGAAGQKQQPQPMQNAFANEMSDRTPIGNTILQGLMAQAMTPNPKFQTGLFAYNPKRTV